MYHKSSSEHSSGGLQVALDDVEVVLEVEDSSATADQLQSPTLAAEMEAALKQGASHAGYTNRTDHQE